MQSERYAKIVTFSIDLDTMLYFVASRYGNTIIDLKRFGIVVFFSMSNSNSQDLEQFFLGI